MRLYNRNEFLNIKISTLKNPEILDALIMHKADKHCIFSIKI